MRRVWMMMATLVAGGPALAAEAPAALSCNAEVVYHCDTVCEQNPFHAGVTLDFKAGSGSYCRGERCDDGRLLVTDVKGDGDGKAYRLFGLTMAGEMALALKGIIALETGSFHADGDIGSFAGRCEVP